MHLCVSVSVYDYLNLDVSVTYCVFDLFFDSMVTDESCDRLAVTDLVKSHVPGAQMSRHHVKELSYRLPLKSVDHFPGMS